MKRMVVCAACKYNDGTIIVGPRHFDGTMRAQIEVFFKDKNPSRPIQGFIDQKGIFMDREEALQVAKESGQLGFFRSKTDPYNELFSEDLY